MTAEATRRLLADCCRSEDLRRLLAAGGAFDRDRWAALSGLGLTGMLAPETAGGSALAVVDLVAVAEACGGAGLPEPLGEHAGVAVPLLAALCGGRHANVLARAATGDDVIAVAHPANPFALVVEPAATVLLLDGTGARLVPAAEIELVRQPSIDPFRRLATVTAASDKGVRLADHDTAAVPFAAAFERGAVLAAADLIGTAQRAVDLAVAYAKERAQFGKPIGSYQAIKHLVATAQVRIEFARPLVAVAAAVCEDCDDLSRARVSHAKLAAGEAADLACRTAVQVHGAMGYSWEVDVHLYLKRALALTGWWGDAALHRRRVEHRILSRPLGPEHTFARGVTQAEGS